MLNKQNCMYETVNVAKMITDLKWLKGIKKINNVKSDLVDFVEFYGLRFDWIVIYDLTWLFRKKSHNTPCWCQKYNNKLKIVYKRKYLS
jgi:hypothetical protein